MRVQFLIRALSLGGAERQLVLLAEGLARRGHSIQVLVFHTGAHQLEERLARSGVDIVRLGKRGRLDLLGFARSFRAAVRKFRPDVVYSFLSTSNVMSALLLRDRTAPAIVWGIRASVLYFPEHDWLGRLMERSVVWLRKVPNAVICNSRAGFDLCRSLRFPPDRLSLVRNVMDLEAFVFDQEARDSFRLAHCIREETLVIGSAGRLVPMKGFSDLLKAFAIFMNRAGRRAVLMIAGDGNQPMRSQLMREARAVGVADSVIWLGSIDDMRAFYSAVDIFCSSSVAEGASNVIAEALACGRMTVVTDVGDAPGLLGNREFVVRAGDPERLATALMKAASRLNAWNSEAARARVTSHSSLETILSETEKELTRAIARRRSRSSLSAYSGS